MSGLLLLVATPIGNLGDLSPRAEDALRTADVIACEDTRHTRKLLNHAGIAGVPVMAVHEHNEMTAASDIVRRVAAGETVALVTDAGMPAISDPGERVVAAVAEAGLKVSVVPGPSAVPAALAVSGLPTERFCFEGFLPRKGAERSRRLRALATEERTSVLYEAPHRLGATAGALAEVCGDDRPVVLVRELSKLHEEVWRGTLGSLVERLAGGDVKGECVLVMAGAPPLEEASDEDIAAALLVAVEGGTSRRDAVNEVADRLGVAKNRVYEVSARR